MDSIINIYIYILDNIYIYIQYCIMCVRYYVKISDMWFTRSSKLLGNLWITVCHEFFVLLWSLCIHKSAESRLGSTAVERMVVKWCRAFCHSWPMASALIKELCVMMLGSTASDNLKAQKIKTPSRELNCPGTLRFQRNWNAWVAWCCLAHLGTNDCGDLLPLVAVLAGRASKSSIFPDSINFASNPPLPSGNLR